MMKKILILTSLFLFLLGNSQIIDPGKYDIKNVNINTKYSDFGTAFFGKDKVVFASPQEGAMITRTTWDGNKQPFLDLFLATIDDKSNLKNKKKILGDVNTKYHEGVVAFTKDLKTVYYSANNYVKKRYRKDSTGTNNIQMFRADVRDNGQWENIKLLPFNSPEFSTGHPTLSLDDKKLYFISDRPESIGKTDIYVVDINGDGTYSAPRNMGPKINTVEREMFPFISDENFLYFSSDGHLGKGELDVFACRVFDTTISEAINLGEPINSEKDDFAFIIDDSNNKGFFSSNREGGNGDDDIYSLVADPPIRIDGKQAISGIIRDIDTGEIIPGVTISLMDDTGKIVAEETIPTELTDNWKPATNKESNLEKVTAIKADMANIKIKRTVDKENPALGEEVEFTVEITNEGRRKAEGIKVEEILPKGYVYVNDDNPQLYDSEGNTISLDELAKKTTVTIKVKAKVLPVEKGAFSFDAKSDTDYKVIIDAPGYLRKEINVKTENDTDIPPLEVGIKLDPELKVIDEKIIININTIYFDFDKWNIRPEAAKELDKVVEVMLDHPSMMIEAGSHTDSRAREAYNQVLSEKRAMATVDYIVSKGIDRNRITARGYGEMQLVNNCSSFVKCKREEHQLNRRTEFVIVNDDARFTSANANVASVKIDKNVNMTYVDLGGTKINSSTTESTDQPSPKEQTTVASDKNLDPYLNDKRPIKKIKPIYIPSEGSVLRKTTKKYVKFDPIYYAYDDWSLSSEELIKLGEVVNVLNEDKDLIVEIQVHTDSKNTEKHNQLLSDKRARSIAGYLALRNVSPDQVYVKGYGEHLLVNKCKSFVKCSEEEHQANRRIEFIIVEGNGFPEEEIINKENARFINTNPIYFNYDKYDIRKDAAYELNRVVEILNANPDIMIEAGSHTDSNNTEAYNQVLSEKRAKSVKDYLISKGISGNRVYSKGYGEMQLVNNCSSFVKCTAEQHQQNRRTEFKIINK